MPKCDKCGSRVGISEDWYELDEEKIMCKSCYEKLQKKELEFTGVDNKKKELINSLKEVSGKPEYLGRDEALSEAILKELVDMKEDLHFIAIILSILFILFIINLIFMFANAFY